ncbi:hypothetical protein TNCV_2150641 [Trichonephila clavipes]|nr:hypothetical protein TNCV_2150641 [Trichonephila clavipes]
MEARRYAVERRSVYTTILQCKLRDECTIRQLYKRTYQHGCQTNQSRNHSKGHHMSKIWLSGFWVNENRKSADASSPIDESAVPAISKNDLSWLFVKDLLQTLRNFNPDDSYTIEHFFSDVEEN